MNRNYTHLPHCYTLMYSFFSKSSSDRPYKEIAALINLNHHMEIDLTKVPSDRLLQTLTAEIVANKTDIIPLELDMATLFALVGQVQFALRHPANTGAGAATARKFVEMVREYISESYPAVAESIRRGWLPEYDVSREEIGDGQQN